MWSQGWLSTKAIGLENADSVMWEAYISSLKDAHLCIRETKDELIKEHAPFGSYSPKHGYIQLNIGNFNREVIWWWKRLWKLKCPSKACLLMWCALENKFPTWYNIQKRRLEGSSYCSLCKMDKETILRLFLKCSFTNLVWQEVNIGT